MAGPSAASSSDKRQIVLASQSPRRRHLLATLGIDATVLVSDVDEEAVIASDRLSGSDPEAFVRVLGERKASDVADVCDIGPALVIGADTIVVHANTVLGKPSDLDDARRMLTMMSNQWIRVVSGVVIVDTAARTVVHRTMTTSCRVGHLDDHTLDRYLSTGVWRDKAGSLAVQHRDPQLIATVEGCWANVAGLPLCEVAQLLVEHGVPIDPTKHCSGSTDGGCSLADMSF